MYNQHVLIYYTTLCGLQYTAIPYYKLLLNVMRFFLRYVLLIHSKCTTD